MSQMNPIHIEPHAPAANIVQNESSKLLPWLMLVCLLSGISLALSIVTLVTYQQNYRMLEREYRLTQNDYDDVKVALELRGMDPHPHLKGQSQ